MQLLIVILKQENWLDRILKELAENGVKGGTILEGRGMAEALYRMEDLPILEAFRSLLTEEVSGKSQVLLFALEDRQVSKTMGVIRKVTGDLDAPNTGVMFTVPIGRIEGFGGQKER